jgi:hypothetical protein
VLGRKFSFFRENHDTFRTSFRFRKRSKKGFCSCPISNDSSIEVDILLIYRFDTFTNHTPMVFSVLLPVYPPLLIPFISPFFIPFISPFRSFLSVPFDPFYHSLLIPFFGPFRSLLSVPFDPFYQSLAIPFISTF